VPERAFVFALGVAREKKVPRGKAVAVDATTPGANAARRAVAHKGTGEGWKEHLRRPTAEVGAEDPTGAAAHRFDRGRTKEVPSQEWQSPTDPGSRITKMKDGWTYLACKAEHTVGLGSAPAASRRASPVP
jgi:hypothetical protein